MLIYISGGDSVLNEMCFFFTCCRIQDLMDCWVVECSFGKADVRLGVADASVVYKNLFPKRGRFGHRSFSIPLKNGKLD